MNKRKLSRYEQMMLASAYNLKYYCSKFEQCKGCIFHKGDFDCRLNEPWIKPAGWTLYMIDKG